MDVVEKVNRAAHFLIRICEKQFIGCTWGVKGELEGFVVSYSVSATNRCYHSKVDFQTAK